MDYMSFSQYNAYRRCPRSWYLDKVRKAEPKQTWYLPIGTAVHRMIEDYLDNDQVPKPDSSSAEIYFYPLIEKQMKIEPDTSKWLYGGSKEDPAIKDKALQQVRDCFEKALEFLDEIDVWEVEYDATGLLPGCEVPIKAFVDIVGEHKKNGPGIYDPKTGKQKPKDNFQLETYAALLRGSKNPDLVAASKGKCAFVMLHPSSAKARPVSLAHINPAEVGARYQQVYEKMQAKLYQTNAGYDCRFCFHQDNCLVNVKFPTKRALYYDRSADDGLPFEGV